MWTHITFVQYFQNEARRQTDRPIHSGAETEIQRGHYIGEKILNDQVFPFPYT